jgi:hypothetical protein
MRYACSQCHTVFEAAADDEHKVCPNCKAEAGLEHVKETIPPAMRYFGGVLLALALLAIGGIVAGIAS